MHPFEPTDQDSPLRPLGATNGHMLACLLDHTRGVAVVGGNNYETLVCQADKQAVYGHRPPPQHQQQPTLLWQQALTLAVEREMDAFIDAGALLVGVSNGEAAQFVLERMPRGTHSRYQGVVYSLVDSGGRQEWRVRGRQGHEWPLTSSPVRERDAFVLFDQHQCRGADMKLRQGAMGMLSLGPGLCKDALMQAAGRMRQLGRGQGLEFVLPVTVAADVARVCHLAHPTTPAAWSELLRPAHLLRWVMANTTAATAVALPMWAEQGLDFVQAKRHQAAHHDGALVAEERLTVMALYDCARRDVTVAEAVHSRVASLVAGRDDEASVQDMFTGIAEAIAQRAREYGGQAMGTTSKTDEECERELERFEEEEREREVEETEDSPATDEAWDLARAWAASSPQQINDRIEPFVGMLRRVDPDWLTMGWEPACINPTDGHPRVYCTINFARPLAKDASRRYADPMHMHIANAYLLWPRTGEVLLLSPTETDAALRAYWDLQASRTTTTTTTTSYDGPVLAHLAYARSVIDTKISEPVRLCLPADSAASLPVSTLAVLQLFNGDTKFGPEEYGDERQRVVEEQLVRDRPAALQAKRLPEVRGKGSELLLSHLELAIKRYA
jgi:hypothetical protein